MSQQQHFSKDALSIRQVSKDVLPVVEKSSQVNVVCQQQQEKYIRCVLP